MRCFPFVAPILLAVTIATPLTRGTTFAQEATPMSGESSPVAVASGARDCLVGRQADGSVLLPTNQSITPAGQQVEFLGRPNAVALRPDGQTAAFLTTENPEPITVVDLAAGTVRQAFTPDADTADEETPGASFAGIVYSADGATLYAADATGALTIADVAADGALTLAERIALPATGDAATSRPGGLALAEDGQTLYIALNMNNTLGVVDLAGRRLAAEIPVGNAPAAVALSGGKAYVANQGGRPADEVDRTNDSGGTDIVADPTTGGVAGGTISIVDLAAGREVGAISVGLQPSALLLHGEYLFVANTNSDTISVVDTATDEVVKTIPVQVFPGAPWGSSPNALAMVAGEDGTGDRLVVSLGRNNALAVYQWRGPAEAVGFEGLVPTGWYPASIALDAASDRLIVANAKGVGSLGPQKAEGPEEENPTGQFVHSNLGSASLISMPEVEEIAAQTTAVFQNNRWTPSANGCTDLQRGDALGAADVAPVAVPKRIGDPSTIKHVFYIIKENRTYDQVLGDMPQGNGDPNLVQFGREVTPNQHALAEQFQLFDNLYVSGSLSADGHQWVTQSYVTDYIEKSFGDFSRAYPFNGADALAYTPTGFLWDNALRNNQTVRAYGEYANVFTDEDDPFGDNFGDWAD